VVVVTKCPDDLPSDKENEITLKINNHAGQEIPVYFSKIKYGSIKVLNGKPESPEKVVAFAGLADSTLFAAYVNNHFDMVDMISFKDHHHYSHQDVIDLAKQASAAEAALLTTEKDMVKFRDKNIIKLLGEVPIFYLPIEHQFLKDGNIFDKLVEDAIGEKYTVEE